MQLTALRITDETVKDSQRTVKGRGPSSASRNNLRPRAKGQPSLNLGGRPKKEFKLAEMARQHAIAVLATLVDVMQDKTATPASRVSAASEVLDRAFGRNPGDEVERRSFLLRAVRGIRQRDQCTNDRGAGFEDKLK